MKNEVVASVCGKMKALLQTRNQQEATFRDSTALIVGTALPFEH
jgi:hypothetical protein